MDPATPPPYMHHQSGSTPSEPALTGLEKGLLHEKEHLPPLPVRPPAPPMTQTVRDGQIIYNAPPTQATIIPPALPTHYDHESQSNQYQQYHAEDMSRGAVVYLPPPNARKRSLWRRFCCMSLRCCLFWLCLIVIAGVILGLVLGLPMSHCCNCLRDYNTCASTANAIDLPTCKTRFIDCAESAFRYFDCSHQLANYNMPCGFSLYY